MKSALRSQGIMLILSSPSGAGKSSIARALLLKDYNTKLSVSATTRQQRPGEVDGEDYHFFSKKEFDELVAQKAFIEHATVFGNQYGTLISEVDPYLVSGVDVIFDVDWQGAKTLRKFKQTDVVSVYILPPSLDELKHRLSKRRQDSEEIISRRMQEATDEISHYSEYDYVVINDDFDKALASVRSILQSERSRVSRLDLLKDVIESL